MPTKTTIAIAALGITASLSAGQVITTDEASLGEQTTSIMVHASPMSWGSRSVAGELLWLDSDWTFNATSDDTAFTGLAVAEVSGDAVTSSATLLFAKETSFAATRTRVLGVTGSLLADGLAPIVESGPVPRPTAPALAPFPSAARLASR